MHIKFALDMITSRTGRSIMTVVLLILGACMIALMAITGKGTQYAYDAVDKLLASGVRGTGVIRIEEADNDLMHEIYDLPEVRAIGSMVEYKIDELPQLANIQNGSSMLNFVVLSYTALNLSRFSLQDGEVITPTPDAGVTYLYLGDNFAEFPVGHEFISDSGVRYVVAGIIEKGQRIIDHDLNAGFEQNRTDYTVSCDNCVIAIEDMLFNSDLFVSAADGFTIDDAFDRAYEIGLKHGQSLRYCSLQTWYEQTLDEVLTLDSILSEILRVIGIAAVVIIVCLQIADILENIRNIGIMYTQGFTQRDMNIIIMIRSLVLYLAAFLLSIYPIYLMAGIWYSLNVRDLTINPDEVAYHMFLANGVPSAAVGLLITLIITYFITIVTFRVLTPIQMLGGKND